MEQVSRVLNHKEEEYPLKFPLIPQIPSLDKIHRTHSIFCFRPETPIHNKLHQSSPQFYIDHRILATNFQPHFPSNNISYMAAISSTPSLLLGMFVLSYTFLHTYFFGSMQPTNFP